MRTGARSTSTSPNSGTTSSNVAVNIEVGGDVPGNIIVGDNNLINTYHTIHGNVINYHTPPAVKPRDMKPNPPRAPRVFIGRDPELKSLEEQIKVGEPVLIHGPDGIGKTTLIKQAANSEPAKSMPEGVLFMEEMGEPATSARYQDIIQQLFDALFESNPRFKADELTARTYLSNTSPLIILDRYDIQKSSLEKLTDLFPRGAIVATNRSALYSDTFDSIEILPLARDESLKLLSTRSGVDNNPANSALLNDACELLGDVPLAITNTATIIGKKKVALGDAADILKRIRPPSQDVIQAAIERSYGLIFSSLDENERNMLAQVAAAPGISVDRAWLESVAGGEQTSKSLEDLELLQANSPRLRLADGFRGVVLSSTRDIKALQESFLNYLLAQLKSKYLDFDFVGDEVGNILGLTQRAANQQRWSDVIALGRAVDPYLTLHGLWDAWEVVLNQVLLAGKSQADEAVQAWALHQLGSREIGTGSIALARKNLIHALQIRESLGDRVGAAYTRHNLMFVLPPKSPKQPRKSLIEQIVSALRNLAGRYRLTLSRIIPVVLIIGLIIAALFLLRPRQNVCPMPEGWEIYRTQSGDSLESISQRVASALGNNLNDMGLPIVKLAIQNANFDCNESGVTPQPRPTLIIPQSVYVPIQPVTSTVVPTVTRAPSQAPSITLNMSIQSDVVSESGQTITYTYTIRNTGGSSIPDSLTIQDSKIKISDIKCPEFNTTGNLDEFLDPNEGISCDATYHVTQADLDRGSITNQANAGRGEIISNSISNTVLVTQNQEIEISKEADPVVYNRVGQEITYTYVVLNSGNVTLSPIQIHITDDRIHGADENILCGPDSTALPPGEMVTCSAVYKITQADIDAGSVTNRASASIYAFGYNLMDSRIPAITGKQTTTTTVNYALPITLEKTADRETYDRVSQVITYTYAVKNINNVPLPGPVTVDDDKVIVTCPTLGALPPTQTSSPSSTLAAIPTAAPTEIFNSTPQATNTPSNPDENLEPGETISCTGMYTISQDDLDFGSVTNEAIAHIGGIESNNAIVTVKADQNRGLELAKSAEPGTFDRVDQTITYTYVISNSGNVTLRGEFYVTDDHIDNNTRYLCGSDALAPNETVTCTRTYNITVNDMDARSVTNKATASWEEISSSASVTVSCPPPPARWVEYVVQQGDTLFRISTSYTDLGTTVSDLQRANCKPTTDLRIGEVLYVPRSPTASITGIVFTDLDLNNEWDPSIDEVAPGTTVTILDLDTQTTFTTTTGSDGRYTFSRLKPGRYRVFQTTLPFLHAGETISDLNFAIIPAN